MSEQAPIPWNLHCPWCEFYIVVNARGGPYGAGEEAAGQMKLHVETHARTWTEFLDTEEPFLPESEDT